MSSRNLAKLIAQLSRCLFAAFGLKLTASGQFHDVFLVNRPDVVVVALDPRIALLLHPRHVMARVRGAALVR